MHARKNLKCVIPEVFLEGLLCFKARLPLYHFRYKSLPDQCFLYKNLCCDHLGSSAPLGLDTLSTNRGGDEIVTSVFVNGTAPTTTYEDNDGPRESVACTIISLVVPRIDGEHSLASLSSTKTAKDIVSRKAGMINESYDTR